MGDLCESICYLRSFRMFVSNEFSGVPPDIMSWDWEQLVLAVE